MAKSPPPNSIQMSAVLDHRGSNVIPHDLISSLDRESNLVNLKVGYNKAELELSPGYELPTAPTKWWSSLR